MKACDKKSKSYKTPMNKCNAIMHVIDTFIKAQPMPTSQMDPVRERLAQALQANPRDARALKDWGMYMGKKHSAMAHKELRRFRRAAVHGKSAFFTDSKIWMLSPFHMT